LHSETGAIGLRVCTWNLHAFLSSPLPRIATLQRLRQASMLIESSSEPLRNPTPACTGRKAALVPAAVSFQTVASSSSYSRTPWPFLTSPDHCYFFLVQSDCSKAIYLALDGDLLIGFPHLQIVRPEYAHCLALSEAQGCFMPVKYEICGILTLSRHRLCFHFF